MSKRIVALIAAATVGLAGVPADRADAMPLGDPAGIRAAYEEMSIVEHVHCRRYIHRHSWGWGYGCHVRGRVYRQRAYRRHRVLRFGILRTGGRRSDIRLKQDIVLLQRLDDGLGLYSFRYLWSDQVYVGVIAQEVQAVRPDAVLRDRDGFLSVDYGRLGMRMQTWDKWIAPR